MTVYYSLYGQLLDINNLYKGFKKVKAAKGAAGIDRQTVGAFALNLEANLKQLQLELQTKQYRAQPVKRVEIPKDDGGVNDRYPRSSRPNSATNTIEHTPTDIRHRLSPIELWV